MPYDETSWGYPEAEGLYDPTMERDACGVGFIVHIDGKTTHQVLLDAQELSRRMTHRGACSADNDTGDGAGALIGVPHKFYKERVKEESGVDLPELGQYGTGIIFMDKETTAQSREQFSTLAQTVGLSVLLWREVGTNNSCLGSMARTTEPTMAQVFVVPSVEGLGEEEVAKRMFMLRKMATHQIPSPGVRFYICSLHTKTIVYKGQFDPCQLWQYYLDLINPLLETHLCIVHTRFSTNTFPSWERAHPMRYLAHNGEINTLRGNVNLMKAREGVMKSSKLGEDLKKLYPVVESGLSDSGSLDCCVEFLMHAGQRSLPEAVMTMVPEAWQNDPAMDPDKKDFYRWASCTMEPWDGPALVTFSDGRFVGAILDRNGLRPSRFYVTTENIMVMASEVGVYDAPAENVIQKGRLMPGKMLLVDTKEQRIIKDGELKAGIAASRPHGQWWDQHVTLDQLSKGFSQQTLFYNPITRDSRVEEGSNILERLWTGDRRMPMFGYTIETIQMLMVPMFKTRKEALGSMGNDAPLACLSKYQPLIYDYFKQLFAQVTNPPIDPFREKIVMSLECPVGPEGNLLEPSASLCHRLWLVNPILSLGDLQTLKTTNYRGWRSAVIDITCSSTATDLGKEIDRICREAEVAATTHQYLILSDRNIGPDRTAIPALLASGAVHYHLISTRLRSKCAVIVETGEAREVHHMCVLVGFGVDAVCPYMVFEIAHMLRNEQLIEPDITDAVVYENYAAAVERGISKVMAKMGISTLQSYKGAQIFEAVGLSSDVIEKCFPGTASRIGGVNFDILLEESLQRHEIAFGENECDSRILRNPGFFHWRSGGEKHINDPTSIGLLQEATKYENKNAYEKYCEAAMNSIKDCTLRGQLEIAFPETGIDISEVEPAANIVKRFATGAMSFGSISLEAHTTLAMAMNRLGGKSNTGEGGEDSDRYLNQDQEFNKRSAIKQVASGRFGVTSAYLSNADELQIKMAQGAKPGEGGELPGYKVTKEIAKTRHSVPGVGLISPPPHHDIYSIEDLAQLIYDLKCANPAARISVKLVSEVGVGVVASGVAKGKSEHILISGHDGGTGASSWTGIKGAGLPWELGLAETHQTLTLNNLRSRIVLQADGQMRTGWDVMVAALLGADEVGFSTAPLIVMGCTMMRKCHLNTCPVGVATQDPELRKKFEGKPEHVVNFFFLVAEQIRGFLARLGCRSWQEAVGRTEFLKQREGLNKKSSTLNFEKILKNALEMRPGAEIVGGSVGQDFELEKRLDGELIKLCQDVIDGKAKKADITMVIRNEQRTFGATLSNKISLKYGETGLPDNSINIQLTGSAGQSFCAFLMAGVSVHLAGDANDYVGKCLSGGKIVVRPPVNVPEGFKSEENVIVGNVCLYGATSGTAFIRGVGAERFCVRNSGATAVIEGVGDHGCEYMTGGRVVILGGTGRNFAAGMSGGIAYVMGEKAKFEKKCNTTMVDLLPVEAAEDLSFLHATITEFVGATGSEVGQAVLDTWPVSATGFVKVFPHEYQRALQELKDEAEAANSISVTVNGDSIMSPNLDIRNAYAIDNTPAVPGMRHVVLPAEAQEPDSDEDSDDEEKIQKKPSKMPVMPKMPVKIIAPPPTKVVEIVENGHTNGVKDIEDSINDIAMKKKKRENLLDKTRGFVKYKRESKLYRDPEERQHDWEEIFDFKNVRRGLKTQAARCMDCGVPFCHSTSHGCPLGNIIPKFNDLVFHSDWKEALNQLTQTNNFPEFTGRVCPAPCEGACVLGINEPPVTIKNIECTIIDNAFDNGWIKATAPRTRTGKKVAIVGSGPSGLAAADQLNKAGHTVTVYERNNRCGGLLMYGIPTMKLSKKVVQRRLDLMAAEGIQFKTSINIGKDVTAQEVKDDNDAMLLCMGATWPRDLPIEGRSLEGIHFAMEFLQTWQQKQHGDSIDHLPFSAKGLDVLVIGGGDTGCDCIGTSLRQGANSITTFEILPTPPNTRAKDNPWPQFPRLFKVDYGHEEVNVKWGGDPRRYNTMSKRFLGDDKGRVAGVETVLVEWTKDEAGRWKMAEVPGSEKTYKCQIVMLAMGFLGPEKYVLDQLELAKDPRGNIKTPSGQYASNIPGVFAAGDCRRGQSLVVWGITEGRQAAREVDTFLMGSSALPGPAGVILPQENLIDQIQIQGC